MQNLQTQTSAIQEMLSTLGITEFNNGACTGTQWLNTNGDILYSYSPADGSKIAGIKQATANEYELVIQQAQNAYEIWRRVPAPKRGEVVRQIGDRLRKFKEPLGKLVSYEMGKI